VKTEGYPEHSKFHEAVSSNHVTVTNECCR